MRKTAMMGKAECRAAQTSEDIQIRSLRCERHGGCCQRRLAVQPGASQTRASQEVGERFQRM